MVTKDKEDVMQLASAIVQFENGVDSPRVERYLNPKVKEEAYILSQQNLPSDTRYKDIKPMSLQEGIQRYNKGDRVKQVPRQIPR